MSYIKAAEYISSKTDLCPKIAVILGTGLGEVAESVNNPVVIPYSEIPGFPSVDKSPHRCRAVIGTVGSVPAVFMQGRLHYYEGLSMRELVFPVHMLKAFGIETLILTNASGAVNTSFAPGDVVLIDDHIKLGLDSPLRGKNPEELGERFFDMTNAYDKGLKKIAERCAEELRIPLNKDVYAYMAGPQFETPAEIRMLNIIGADLVGMSTVPEVIAAAHCGIRVLGLSGVSNMAAGISGGGLNREAIENAEPLLRKKMSALIKNIIYKIDTEV